MLTDKAAHRKDIATGLADMQHRHFATIATIIREMPEKIGNREIIGIREDVAEYFADRLRGTNPNFDRSRFLRACGNQVSRFQRSNKDA